jgi:OOP family OmpA-OmpF porin
MRLRWTGEMIEVSGLAADATTRRLIESYAAATFGRASLRPALALGGRGVPADWDLAALAALDALGAAATGEAELAPGRIALSGTTAGGAEAGRLHRTLAEAAPEGYAVTTALTVDLPAAVAAVPLTPARCARALNDAVLVQPIGFDPGSAVFESGSGDKLDRLASILRRCTPAPIEIGGHTDSQGSTDLNQRLSRARAEAVLDALLARGVRLDNMRARGYGESQPVASNDTEAGRALNRRIAFRAPEEAD